MNGSYRQRLTLLEAFEQAGEWWLPEDHRDRVAGTVSFDPNDGVELCTIGAFKSSWQGTGSDKPFRPPLILGFWGPSNTPITLHKTTRIGNVRASLERPDSTTLHAVCMIVGHHFHAEGDLTLASVRAEFTSLEEWTGHRPFNSAEPDEARYAPIEPVAVEVEALGARLTIGSASSRSGDGIRTLGLDHRVFIDIEPEGKRPLKWYRDLLSSLQDLLTLLVGRSVYPRSMQAQVNTGGSARSDVFFGQGARLPESRGKVPGEGLVRSSDVLVPLPLIRSELPEVLGNWFAKRDLLAPVYELFLGALFNAKIYTDFQFLSLAQGLETYHRRTNPDARYLPEQEYLEEHYPEIVSSLPPSLPEALRNKLKTTLWYANEWSLRKRLKELVGAVPITGIAGDDPTLIQRVVNTRNYLTHYTEELERDAMRGPKLMEAVEELRRLLAFLLLQELGLDTVFVCTEISTKVPKSTYLSLED